MTIIRMESNATPTADVYDIRGLSTETKPSGVPVGSTFLEADTGNLYMFDTEWTLKITNIFA
jgi:hypothetical protein